MVIVSVSVIVACSFGMAYAILGRGKCQRREAEREAFMVHICSLLLDDMPKDKCAH